MDNELQIFKHSQFGQIRWIKFNEKDYAVGIDIAKALGYKNPNDAISRHCKGYVKHVVPTNSGVQQMNVIPEGDIYRLTAKSELPGAEKFESWIFDEVLPSIRKHGAYMTDDVIEKALTSPDFLIQLATNLKKEKQKRVLAEQKIEEQKPLVNFANKVSVSENSLLVREVAKIASKKGITIGEKRLWNKLREWNLILKNSTEPKQYGIDRGYFEVVEGTRESSKGTFSYKTTRVTGKGQVYIISRLQKEFSQQEVACTK